VEHFCGAAWQLPGSCLVQMVEIYDGFPMRDGGWCRRAISSVSLEANSQNKSTASSLQRFSSNSTRFLSWNPLQKPRDGTTCLQVHVKKDVTSRAGLFDSLSSIFSFCTYFCCSTRCFIKYIPAFYFLYAFQASYTFKLYLNTTMAIITPHNSVILYCGIGPRVWRHLTNISGILQRET
jgi:hypothetical protein